MRSSKKSTYRFIESIRLEDGEPQLIAYHESRLRHALRTHFIDSPLMHQSLSDVMPTMRPLGRAKWRLVVDGDGVSSTVTPYIQLKWSALQPVLYTGHYADKYADRSSISACDNQVPDNVLPMLHKADGRLLDTTVANVALHIAGTWYTPMYPLLHGVMRAYLIDTERIKPKDLYLQDFAVCDQVAVFNALIPWSDAWRFTNTLETC